MFTNPNIMKKIISILAIISLFTLTSCGTQQQKERPITYLPYSGAWFDIEYPADFIIREREKSPTGSGYDGVVFREQNGDVEFYVYSPQWSGTSEFETQLENEELLEETTQEDFGKTVTFIKLHDIDDNYYREYKVFEENEGTVRYLYGFKYKTEKLHTKYLDAYNHFANTLVQYAD